MNSAPPNGPWDASKLTLPIVLVGGMLATAVGLGMWVQTRMGSVDYSANQLSELKLQVSQLSAQVTQISVALAKGPTLPDNVAYKADLLKFCVMNRQLQCPQF